MPQRPNGPKEFWAGVRQPDSPDSCWLWVRSMDRDGYGQVRYDGKMRRATHVAWYLTYGTWPMRQLLHSCDNPPCVQPLHLREGSNLDNVRDRDERGRTARGDRHGFRLHPHRAPRGERNAAARLSARKVRQLRVLAREGVSTGSLAKRFGVSTSTCRRIVCRKLWSHV